jgi:hypothetical protein
MPTRSGHAPSARVAPVDLHKDLLCRGNGMMSRGRVLKRRAEDRHEAVAEEFVDGLGRRIRRR